MTSFRTKYSMTAGGCLNIKMSSYQCMDPMLNMGIPIPVKDGLYIETEPWCPYPFRRMAIGNHSFVRKSLSPKIKDFNYQFQIISKKYILCRKKNMNGVFNNIITWKYMDTHHELMWKVCHLKIAILFSDSEINIYTFRLRHLTGADSLDLTNINWYEMKLSWFYGTCDFSYDTLYVLVVRKSDYLYCYQHNNGCMFVQRLFTWYTSREMCG